MHGLSVWGCTSPNNHLSTIDKFLHRGLRFGYLKSARAMPIIDVTSDNGRNSSDGFECSSADFGCQLDRNWLFALHLSENTPQKQQQLYQ